MDSRSYLIRTLPQSIKFLELNIVDRDLDSVSRFQFIFKPITHKLLDKVSKTPVVSENVRN